MTHNQINFTKLKVCNYNRKSSESEDKQVLSIGSQRDEAQRIADFYKLPTFVKVFTESKSAKKEFLRPDFLAMVEMIKKGSIDSIVCWKLDRLARNMSEGGMLIDLLSSGVLKAIITHDKVYYPSDNVLLMSVEFGQGKQFVKDLSINVKRGQTKKATLGVPHGCASLGFLNDKTEEKGNRNWIVDSEKFWKIQKLFEMFLTGTYSAGKLYDYAVKELGLTTVKRKRTGGSLIVPSRIYEILKDPIYAGFFYYGGERYELTKELPRMISESERNRVLQILSSKNIPKIQHHESIYSGFIQSEQNDFVGQDMKFQLICDCKFKFSYRDKTNCPNCHKKIDHLENPKYLIKSYYYNVRKKKNKLPYKSIEESEITNELRKYIVGNLDFSNSLLGWSKKYIHELKDKEVSENLLLTQNKVIRKNEFDQKKHKLREMLRDEKIIHDEYKEDLAILTEQFKDINISTDHNDWYSEMIEITDVLEKVTKIFDKEGPIQAKRNILSKLGSNLIWNDEKLSIYSKKSIETLIEGVKLIKLQYPKFEPKNYVVKYGSKEKTEPNDPVFSMMLRR
jgi:site-specific DNA recombinase